MQDKKEIQWPQTKIGSIIGLVTSTAWTAISVWQVMVFINRNDAKLTCVATLQMVFAAYCTVKAFKELLKALKRQEDERLSKLRNYKF